MFLVIPIETLVVYLAYLFVEFRHGRSRKAAGVGVTSRLSTPHPEASNFGSRRFNRHGLHDNSGPLRGAECELPQ